MAVTSKALVKQRSDPPRSRGRAWPPLPAPGRGLGFHQLALSVRDEVGHRLAKVPGPCLGLEPSVQALGSEPFPVDFAAELADAVHQLIDEVTVALVEPLGFSENAVVISDPPCV